MLSKVARVSSQWKVYSEIIPTMHSFANLNKVIHQRMLSNNSGEVHGRGDTSMSIKNVDKDLDNKYLKVGWSDGTTSRFPYNYLRDNCTCSQCFEYSSKQKLFNTARDIKMNIEVDKVTVSEDGQYLKCMWPGGHESGYSVDILYDMKLPEEKKLKQQNSDSLVKDEIILWNREKMQDKIRHFDYDAIMNLDDSLFDLLYCCYQRGIVIIDKAPTRDGALIELTRKFGYSNRTHYGEFFNVKDVDDPSNLAYTNQVLPLHSDQPYLMHPPEIQLLHCIQGYEKGGNSIFVDAFHVSNQLHKNHHVAFEVLKNFPVCYFDIGSDAFGDFFVGCSQPIIGLNKHGRLQRFVYSPSAEAVGKGDCTPDELLAFYNASCFLTKALNHPENVIDIQLKSGQIAMFQNNRVLHGRSAFDGTGEPRPRWMQGIYCEWDVIFSKLRVLQKKLGLKTPYLYDHSDDFF